MARDLDEDLFDFGGATPAEGARAEPPAPLPSPGGTRGTAFSLPPGGDPDEDLFDFAPVPDVEKMLAAYLSSRPEPEPDERNEGGGHREAPEPRREPPSPPPQSPPPRPERRAAAPPPAPAPAPVRRPIGATPPRRREGSRLVELLAAAFLLVNGALILLAWRASSSFQETLARVTAEVNETLAAHGREPSAVDPARAPQVAARAVAGLPARPAGQLEDLQAQSVRIARGLVAEGRYMDARRQLYLLLANRDMAPLDRALAAEAEYLVAETYELQGRALAEAGR